MNNDITISNYSSLLHHPYIIFVRIIINSKIEAQIEEKSNKVGNACASTPNIDRIDQIEKKNPPAVDANELIFFTYIAIIYKNSKMNEKVKINPIFIKIFLFKLILNLN